MMKKVILIMIVGALLLFSGCSSGQNTKNSGFNLGSSFKGGNEALKISFDPSMPPAIIKDQGLMAFNIRVIAENMGEFKIPENSTYVKLTGFDPVLFNLNPNLTSKLFPAMRGVRVQGKNTIPGAKQTVMFNQLKYLDTIVSGSYNININANVCYPYQTEAVADLCIGQNTVGTTGNAFQNCVIEEQKSFANSGAPVQIENFQELSNGPGSIQFQFDIVHKPLSTSGTIFLLKSMDNNCNVGGKAPNSYDAINFKDRVLYAVSTGINGLNCEGTGKNNNAVILSNNKYTVTCTQDTTGQGEAYNKLIRIKLGYHYLDRISKTINVEHVQRRN